MRLFPILSMVLLFSAGCSNASTLEDLIRNGTRLEWTYVRGGVRYYMTPDITADVIDSERQRFNVSYTISPPMPMVTDLPTTVFTTDLPTTVFTTDLPTTVFTTTSVPQSTTTSPTTTRPTTTMPPPTTTPPPLPGQIRTQFQTDPSRFVAVTGETLVKGTNPAQYLFLYPIEGSDNEFHLYYNNVPFVTPRTRAPFDFFLRQRFPDEPLAIFSLQPYQFHLNSSYRGNRSHILSTLWEISTLVPFSERISAYTDLFARMSFFDHVTGGSEIFALGQHISKYVASYNDTPLFASLPDQVRHIVQSSSESYRLQIFHLEEDGTLLPLNEHLALVHPATSYPFHVRPTSNVGPTFQSSVQSGTGYYWGKNGGALTSGTAPSTIFEFHFPSNSTDYFYIMADYIFLSEESRNNAIISFCTCGWPKPESRFVASILQFNVSRVYTGIRSQIPDAAHFIWKYSEGEEEAAERYVELVDLMRGYGHFPGLEVFTVAAYMVDSLKENHVAFYLLPDTARLIFAGNLSLTYEDEGGAGYPMKYSWSSDLHEGIAPYTFVPAVFMQNQRARNILVGIVYGVVSGSRQRIFVDPTTRQLTQEILAGNVTREFALELGQDLLSLTILWENTDRLGTWDTEPDFYFEANNTIGQPARFKISNY